MWASRRRFASVLPLFLGIVLGGPLRSEASSVAISTNQTIYQPGDPVVLTLLLSPTLLPTPQPALNRGDLYVQVTLPDGSILFLDQNAQFTAAARPFRPDLTVAAPSETEIFSFQFAPVLPQGTYTLLAFQAKTGSDPTNPANLVSTGFPVRVAFIAPTSPVGGNVAIPLTSIISRVAVHPQTSTGSTAILTRSPSSVSLVNLVTNKVVLSIPTSRPLDLGRDIGLNPVTNVAVVPFRSTPPSIGIIDLNTTQIATVNLPPLPNPANPGEFVRISSIGIDVGTNRAVVGLFSNTASGRLESNTTIDLAARTIISSVTISPSIPIDNFVLGPSGTTLFGFGGVNSQTLVERDVATGDLIRSFSFGGFVLGKIALLTAQNRLVIGTIPLIAPSVPQGIGLTTLDLGTGTTASPVVLSGTGIFRDLAVNPTNNQAILLGCPDPPNCLASQVFTVDLVTFAFSSRTIPGTAVVVALDTSSGALLLPVDISLDVIQTAAVPVLPSTGRLSVTVRALETGAPIAGATAAIQGTGLAQVTTPGVFSFNTPGGASFPEVPAGLQTVSVSAFGFAPATMPVTIQAGQQNPITISPSQPAPVPDARGTYTVSGQNTETNCQDPSQNGTHPISGEVRITAQTGANFSGSATLNQVNGIPQRIEITLNGSIDGAGQFSGAFTFMTFKNNDLSNSGSGTLSGSLAGNAIKLAITVKGFCTTMVSLSGTRVVSASTATDLATAQATRIVGVAAAQEVTRQADIAPATGTLTGIVVSGVSLSLGAEAAAEGAPGQVAAQRGRGHPADTGVAVPNQAPPSCVPANATPIPGATVALPSSGPPIEATTGPDGTFFLAQTPSGSALVAVRVPGQNTTTQLATIEQALENCIVVTLLPTLNPDAPTTAVTLNAASYRPGQTLTVDRSLTLRSATPTQADEYLVGIFPDGQTLVSLVAAPCGQPGILFGVGRFRCDFSVTSVTDRVLQYTFGGPEPQGTYQAVGRLVKPSGNFLNPADWLNTTTTSFTFGP